MAIQQLTQPIVNPIAAFDSTKEHEITFIVIGGAQVTGNRVVITNNKTGNVVYEKITATMKLAVTIPANTLSNNNYYNVVIYTIDNANNQSNPSTPVPFYCYSQPTLTITNIPATETIGNGTYGFQGNYLQSEGEQLNSYQFILYDSNRNILDRSDIIYYQSNSSLAYTFVGMDNDTSYYVELKGQTVNNTEITSGLMYFTVRYIQPATFAIVDLINDCENGYIQISSNIVAIDGKSNPEPPIYIDDKEVDLRDKDSWVKWDEGFNINNDFTMRVWGRDFNDYERIISLANKENTPDNPNKIEMKWMIADVIETLPSYTSVSGKNIAIKNGFKTDIEDLEIMGNSEQISKAPVDLGTGNYIKAETTRDVYLDIDVYGNQYQATREESKSTVTGTEITVNDTYINNQTKFNIDGNSYQETTEGYQLLNLQSGMQNGITYYVDDEGYFCMSGICTSDRITLNLNELVLNGTYTFTNKSISGGGINCVLKDNTPEYKNVFTKNNETKELNTILKDLVCYLTNGATYNSKIKLMLVSGSQEKDVEPYTGGQPSPNPEYPQDIEVIDGVNRFDINKLKQGTWNNAYALQRVTIWATKIDIGESYTIINYDTSKYNFSCGVSSSNGYNESATASDDSGWLTSSTYTITASTTGYLFIQIKTPTGKDIKPSDLLLSDFQIIKGTITKPYLPYGCIGLEQSGLNKLKLTLQTTTINGITYTNNGDGTFNVNGTATANTRFELNSNLLDVIKLNTSYYVYTSVAYNIDTFNVSVSMRKNSNNAMIWMIGGKVSISPNEELNSARLDLYFKSGTTVNQNNVKIMLVESAVVNDEWEPYHEPVIHPINLNGNSIAKVEDVKDLLKVYRNGDVEIDKKTIKFVKDVFTESFKNDVCFYFQTQLDFYKVHETFSVMNNYFKHIFNSFINGVTGSMLTWDGKLNCSVKYGEFGFTEDMTEAEALAKINDIISNKPMEIYCKLYEDSRETIKLPSIEPIKLWEGTNKFELITNLDTEMELEYNYIPQSPSPEAPSEIETVGSNVNLLNNTLQSQTKNGLKVTVNKDKSVTVVGTATANTNIVFDVHNKTIEAGTYTLKDCRTFIESTENQGWWNDGQTKTFTNTATLTNYGFFMFYSSGTVVNETLYPKLEKGSKATPYSPYGMGSAEIDVVNKNLFDKNKVEQDYRLGSTGDLFPEKGYFTSDYIGLYPNTSYTLTINETGRNTAYAIYDNKKKIILRVFSLNKKTYLITNDTSSKQYIRIAELLTDIDNVQLEVGSTSTDIVEHQSQTAIMPIQQEMLTGDYVADVEHHEWEKLVLDGNENWLYDSSHNRFYFTLINNPNTLFKDFALCTHYKNGDSETTNYEFNTGSTQIFIRDENYSSVPDWKTYLQSQNAVGTPVIVYYKLATPANLELTEEQKAIQSTLKPAYANITNIYATEDLPILKVSTLRVPSPSVPSPIYSSGDQRNLLEDLGLFDISYTQDYFKVTDTIFKLKPNFVYNLSFDYTINNASTDLYFTVCYKNGNNITDITGAVLYYNQATGRSNTSFMVPEDIPNNSTLSVKFVRTLIPANVNVSISNVQLEKGRVAHNYQKHGLYNIYPTATQKNIFDYDKIYYVENKNTEISYIQNGISANLAGTNETAYIAIGFPNILQPGQKYAISYNSYGDLLSSKLYTMNKETGERVEEITLDNGSFTAPSNVYDFLFEFTLNDMVENNQVQIWNIQIETGDQVTEYEVYKPNQTTITLDQPLRAIGNYKDIICLESPNLLNPQTQIANVKGGQDYYFSQSGNTQYQLNYLTEYGNLISSVNMVSGKITVPDTCVQIRINASSSDITSSKIQINEGDTAGIYYPYVNEPSIIRYIKKVILNGTENWNLQSINSYGIANFNCQTGQSAVEVKFNILSNYFKTQTTRIAETTNEGIFMQWSSEFFIRIKSNRASTIDEFKAYLKQQYEAGTPITVNYVLTNPTAEQLSSDNILALQNLKTYEGTSNVFTSNNMPANINFSYISGQSEQATKNAYVTLKCWNGNVMPYFVHSNYIDIPKETDKVFIWVRKKNNIFDLKIENLGDYQGETT